MIVKSQGQDKILKFKEGIEPYSTLVAITVFYLMTIKPFVLINGKLEGLLSYALGVDKLYVLSHKGKILDSLLENVEPH